MSASSTSPRAAAPLALALLAAIAACGVANTFSPATTANALGTVTLWALTGTSLLNPSAYDMLGQSVARTDRTSGFDFAFDVRVDTLHDTSTVLLPRGALGLYTDGGLLVTTQPFDSITIAPTSGYQDTVAVPVKVGTVILAQSRQETCSNGYIKPLYAKLNITAVDLVARSITFAIVPNVNCGYRSLIVDTVPPTY